ncbi:MAG: glyoxalase [Lachnospiraceae bacterium]|jgi:hypothetical protein|uniref:hypothetical protein n=1 Tax=Clostridium sp. (strain SY8519) TaxID=1042156 RepID=UPI0002171B00|nr:hypothetical protein [Clostridium sp. SY8519]MCI1654530.1 glyoxalase [Lachnospiraceae bacterium]MCI1656983.1 glyoxalase [Lachnospiraceae bacterium]MCI2195463.1 glyoxalase [Lachnospiraceae bacterium]BAK48105.1 histone acetyltransferase HPA2 [Clostridium sp. SY8519]HAD20125.1 glyoxalase [Lachnospiraceae bacterium]
MNEYDDMCLETFLENQLQLLPEEVAQTPEEAEEFLEECMATVCENKQEVLAYFKETGADITGVDDFDNVAEVFPLPDGRYLIVEA